MEKRHQVITAFVHSNYPTMLHGAYVARESPQAQRQHGLLLDTPFPDYEETHKNLPPITRAAWALPLSLPPPPQLQTSIYLPKFEMMNI